MMERPQESPASPESLTPAGCATHAVVDDILSAGDLLALRAWAQEGPLSTCALDGAVQSAVARLGEALQRCDAVVGRLGWGDAGLRAVRCSVGQARCLSDDLDAGYWELYVHDRWSAFWGGELYIAARDDARGIASYVAPWPNRLVVVAPHARCTAAPVDPEAEPHALRALVAHVRSGGRPVGP